MKKSLLLTSLTVCLLLVALSTNMYFAQGLLTLSDSTQTIGFQNGSYIGFADAMTFKTAVDGGGTYQESSSNTSYPDFMFFQEQLSASGHYGFWVSGCNVTVTNFFTSSFLQMVADGAGTIKVYVGTLGAPVLVTGASGIFDNTLSVAVLTVTAAGQVQLNFGSGGGGGGGGNPTPTPTATSPASTNTLPTSTPNALGSVDFRIADLNLGTINPNSTVTVNLAFRFTGSSYTLQTLTLSTPFQSWLVPTANFSQYTYIQTSATENSGSATLIFNIPAYIAVQAYSGTISVTALDGFGVVHTSTAKISAVAAGATVGFDWINWIKNNPIYIILAVIGVLAVLTCIATFSRRHH